MDREFWKFFKKLCEFIGKSLCVGILVIGILIGLFVIRGALKLEVDHFVHSKFCFRDSCQFKLPNGGLN